MVQLTHQGSSNQRLWGTKMNEKEFTNANQIIRIDSKGCFVEVVNTYFAGFDRHAPDFRGNGMQGRVWLNFLSYSEDRSSQSGFRASKKIGLSVTFDEWLGLTAAMQSGKLDRLAAQRRSAGDKFMKPVFERMGGQKASDGKMCLSKILTLIPGSTAAWLLTAEECAGEQDGKGLIVPRKDAVRTKISIPLRDFAIENMLMTVSTHIEAYLSHQYASGAISTQNQFAI